MTKILQKLKGGDLRSIGRTDEVVEEILQNPCLFSDVFEGMLYDDPIVRMRSADALEKVSKIHPEFLQPFKNRLINEISKIHPGQGCNVFGGKFPLQISVIPCYGNHGCIICGIADGWNKYFPVPLFCFQQNSFSQS